MPEYVPPVPDSPRYRRMMNAYFRIKYMDSTDAILFIDRFVEEEKQNPPEPCPRCSEPGVLTWHWHCPKAAAKCQFEPSVCPICNDE